MVTSMRPSLGAQRLSEIGEREGVGALERDARWKLLMRREEAIEAEAAAERLFIFENVETKRQHSLSLLSLE
jgi:hypothetical protein